MSRASLTLSLAWLLYCAPGVAAQSGGFPIGDTIRVEKAILVSGNARAPGVLLDQRGDTIVMRTLLWNEEDPYWDGETTLVLTRDSRVLVRSGSKPLGIRNGALLGGLVGGLAAVVVRYATKDCETRGGSYTVWLTTHTYQSEECSYSSGTAAAVFLGGTVLGGVLGAIIKQDQWLEVGPGSVGFGLDFTPVAASASLQIRF
ncbi:MAG: hypothetical protein JSU98_16880 [Gemmatimonadales bacterium]|nr:MAG: hypothetical protein JSU98_16880 [Gemmatimonadales bacterium]